MEKLKIDSEVEVINKGHQYPTHSIAAADMKAKKWKSGNFCENGDIGIIVNIQLYGSVLIVLINIKGKEVLIGSTGLKLIKKSKKSKKFNNYKLFGI